MRNKKVLFVTQAAMIAAVYIVLTYFVSAFNLASGAIQVRISEALTILPYFTPAAIPGLFIGCLLSNLLTGSVLLDVIFGSLATLLGALGTYALRQHKFLLTLPPVLSNAIIVPLLLKFVYFPDVAYHIHGIDVTILFYMVTVGIGEIISVCLLGSLLLRLLTPYRQYIEGGTTFNQ
ncbi:MAG: QueT transporter family protein [Lachnospiraceae bacterium]|nr:QueT transporter family protein [Lachnospiraceae bacterium]